MRAGVRPVRHNMVFVRNFNDCLTVPSWAPPREVPYVAHRAGPIFWNFLPEIRCCGNTVRNHLAGVRCWGLVASDRQSERRDLPRSTSPA